MNFGFLGTILTILLVVGFITNVVLAFVIIFLERDRRTASSTWAWLFVLFVLPVIGFIFVSIFRTNGFQEKDGKNNGDELHAFEDLVKTKSTVLINIIMVISMIKSLNTVI